MATPNFARWVGNLMGIKEPLIQKGLFQTGATAAIDAGELLEFTGNGNTAWVPMDSDFAGAGNVAVANANLKDGDRAGYYEIIVPRPGDMFEFAITSAATVIGQALYWSNSETVKSSGSNILGYAAGMEHYPKFQNFLSEGNPSDSGTTIRSQDTVKMTILAASSVYLKYTA